ncbi:M3 family oligoendopeptidase [Desulfobulbus oralis]|nr:M3 family oligoendopeptidase [Desulfobulbus oralis]
MSTQNSNMALGVDSVRWNLRFLYENAGPALEADMARCREASQALADRYAGRVARLTAAGLLDLVRGLEALEERLGRLESYAYLNFITQTEDAPASALMQQIEALTAELGRQTVFFRVEWNQLPAETAERLLAAPELAVYRHYLTVLRNRAPHQLGLQEEQLLQALAPVGRSAWNTLFDKLMSQLRFGPDQRTEEEVLAGLYRPERPLRQQAALELTRGLQDNLHILTHIFNTLAQEKAIMDRLRRYPHWDSAINLHNELKPETVSTLLDTVTSGYGIVQRYYRMKRELLGLDELFDYDRYAPLPGAEGEKALSWPECRSVVLEAFAAFSPEMAEMADGFFRERRLHAPVLPGKASGAFAHPTVPSARPYVLLNYTGRREDVFTLAHELGHGVHQTLAARQGLYNSDTPLVLAETASVFAEMLVFRAMLKRERSATRRCALVAGKLESIFATVFRQVAMNRFEAAMHEGRSRGELSAERLSALWLDTQGAMFADSVTLTDNYRLWWAYIPHFLATPGYVYAYAFGELLVLALYARYEQEGWAFVPAYLRLLAAGGSRDPYALLAPFGIDLDDPAFWQGGLELIRALLAEAEEASAVQGRD